MLDLKQRRPDVRAYVAALEEWIIRQRWPPSMCGASAAKIGLAYGSAGRTRVPAVEDKIAAIGVRLRRWVSFHGISINVEPDLSHFAAIVLAASRTRATASPAFPIWATL